MTAFTEPQNPKLGVYASPEEWRERLDSLPDRQALGGKIPSFYYPALLWPKNLDNPRGDLMGDISGPDGLLPQFLRDFGKTLIDKYNPKGIIVFSAHWDDAELLVTDYKPENPLLYDYYGFPEQLYDITYRSRGDSALSAHITETFMSHGLTARTTPITEPRGRDGRRRNRPSVESGLDHGLMFPDTASPDGVFPIPIVEVSMSSTFEPEPQWEIGAAIKELREQGYLILGGGLTVHDFGDFSSFNSDRAKPLYHIWNDKIIHAINTKGSAEERKAALFDLVNQPEYVIAHRPRDDHFLPIYIAAGAGEDGETKLLSGLFGATTVAFGL
ncbi:hypothetical protein QFC20_005030 [Naganishia adeliensis]|uniref:Uncharacterized protein n=1 Tax=Naganishia adeliensis TaxID=92952 RepID=A0ACC2VSU6_9TREE|nr:hypothetical protein QFC20_005030 [Naganishia adeliensis]